MERNIRLDYYKIMLSIMVVSTHMHPLFAADSMIGWLIANGISRIAVPSFYIISGYYIFPKIKDSRAVSKYVKRLLIIYAVWTLLYLPYLMGLSAKSMIFFAAFGHGHLWYMPATIIGVLLVFLFKKFIKKDIYILGIALILYLTGMAVSIIEGVDYFTVYLFRNGLTYGFVFTMIGCFIRSKEYEKWVSDKQIITIVSAFTILLLGEAYFRFDHLQQLGPYQDFTLATLVLCPALLILVQKHPSYAKGSGFMNVLSSGIYFIHPFAINTITISFAFGIYKFPVVLALTIALSYVIYLLNKRVKIFF